MRSSILNTPRLKRCRKSDKSPPVIRMFAIESKSKRFSTYWSIKLFIFRIQILLSIEDLTDTCENFNKSNNSWRRRYSLPDYGCPHPGKAYCRSCRRWSYKSDCCRRWQNGLRNLDSHHYNYTPNPRNRQCPLPKFCFYTINEQTARKFERFAIFSNTWMALKIAPLFSNNHWCQEFMFRSITEYIPACQSNSAV